MKKSCTNLGTQDTIMSLHSSAIPTKLMWKKYLKAVQNVDKIFENLTKMYGTCTKCGQNVWNLYKVWTKCFET